MRANVYRTLPANVYRAYRPRMYIARLFTAGARAYFTARDPRACATPPLPYNYSNVALFKEKIAVNQT